MFCPDCEGDGEIGGETCAPCDGVGIVTRHVKQPTDSSCVQACLAMYLEQSIDFIFKSLPNRKGGTKHKAMITFLRECGVTCADHMTSAVGKRLPRVALVRITWPNKKAHIVLKFGRTWHDPLLDAPFKGDLPASREWSGGGRVTSFLELTD